VSFKQAQRKVQPATGGTFSRTASVPSIELSIASKSIKVNTSISYRSNATKGLDAGYDVGNFDGAGLDIYTRLLDGSSEKNFTYQSLPTETNETVVIPVGVKAAAGTSIIISAESTSLPEGAEVYLEDRLLEKYIDLTKESYQVTLSQSENGIGRFYLHSKVEVIIPEVTSEDIKLYTANQTLFVEGIQGERFEVALYNTLGSLVYQGEFTGSGKNSIALPTVETGVYVVNVKSTIGVINKKVILKKISIDENTKYDKSRK
ncbi:T9SS type A sorting domain-containing protein, partial [Tenacibaculum sp. 190130A14a]